MQWTDGRIYRGGYVSDVKAGNGEFISKGVCIYRGQWLGDLPNGKGTGYSNGSFLTGTWVNGFF